MRLGHRHHRGKCRHSQKAATCKPRGAASFGHLDPGLAASTALSLKPPGLWYYVVMAALAK